VAHPLGNTVRGIPVWGPVWRTDTGISTAGNHQGEHHQGTLLRKFCERTPGGPNQGKPFGDRHCERTLFQHPGVPLAGPKNWSLPGETHQGNKCRKQPKGTHTGDPLWDTTCGARLGYTNKENSLGEPLGKSLLGNPT
jgi:hypothetical protein